jgi:DNA processing protein
MQTEVLMAIYSIKGIGPKVIRDIFKYVKEFNILGYQDINIEHLLKNIPKNKADILNNLKPSIFNDLVDKQLHLLKDYISQDIHVIHCNDERYSSVLKQTKDYPPFLYCKGNIKRLQDNKKVAVVGTRQNTYLGEKITQKSVEFLCSQGFTIVSGLALGIDAIAHKQAIDSKGKTIAVLVDVKNIQPSKNKGLSDQILAQDGLLIAENPPGTPIFPGLFVSRDKIQSGLSLGVFAIETSLNGGTMHAVNHALGEKRLLFCPDISKLHYTSCTQIEGIEKLITNGSAMPYSKEVYPKVISLLRQKEEELSSATLNED